MTAVFGPLRGTNSDCRKFELRDGVGGDRGGDGGGLPVNIRVIDQIDCKRKSKDHH